MHKHFRYAEVKGRNEAQRHHYTAIKSSSVCCVDTALLDKYGLACYEPDKSLLPAALRRRSSLTTRMAITAAHHACMIAQVDAHKLPAIFASVGGEIQVTDELCRMLPNGNALLSPTQFHNSVHNTTAAYWTILQGCQAPSTALAALDDTFAIGLLEASVQLKQMPGDTLLVCYDEQWPQYLAPPMGKIPMACAVVLSNTSIADAGFIISPPAIKALRTSWDTDLLELVHAAPPAAAIPLLQALQKGQPQENVPLNCNGARWYTQLTLI